MSANKLLAVIDALHNNKNSDENLKNNPPKPTIPFPGLVQMSLIRLGSDVMLLCCWWWFGS